MNDVRGERRLTIGKVEYVFLPTHQAISRVEGELKRRGFADEGVYDIARRLLKKNPRHTDLAIVLHECSREGGKELPYPQALDFSFEDFAAAIGCVQDLILLRYGPREEASPAGKAEATSS